MQGNGNQGPPGYPPPPPYGPPPPNPYSPPGAPPQGPPPGYYAQPVYVVQPQGMDTMQIVCLVWGIVCAVFFLVALVPCLGALNWINVPLAIPGLVVSIVRTAGAPPGAPRGGSITGIACCAVAVVFGILRLVLGGGVV